MGQWKVGEKAGGAIKDKAGAAVEGGRKQVWQWEDEMISEL